MVVVPCNNKIKKEQFSGCLKTIPNTNETKFMMFEREAPSLRDEKILPKYYFSYIFDFVNVISG